MVKKQNKNIADLIAVSKRLNDLYDAFIDRAKLKKDLQSLNERVNAILSRLKRDRFAQTTFLEDRLFLADIQDMQRLNEPAAGMYATNFNFLQIGRFNPEDFRKLEGLILPVLDLTTQRKMFRQPVSVYEAVDYFTHALLWSLSETQYSRKINLADESYLKFVQALHLSRNYFAAEETSGEYNVFQLNSAGQTSEKILKQIEKTGSRYGYGLVLK